MSTILIVDDVAAVRKALGAVLREHGHRLIEAHDGVAALRAVATERPDIVITDVLMPAMDGYELVRRLRQEGEGRNIPILFHTAPYGERDARTFAAANGVASVLTKPAEPAAVLAIVSRLLAGEPTTLDPRADELAAVRPGLDREHLPLLVDPAPGAAEDLRAANARLRALINIGLELASERNPDALLNSVCEAARDLFGATYVTLGIVELNDQRIKHVASCGTALEPWITIGSPVPGLLATVVSERRTVRGENPDGAPAKVRLPDLHPPAKAFVVAPVVSPACVYGWFCLVGNDGRTFSEEDEHLVTALAGQVGRIYESATFSAVAQQRAEELRLEIAERKEAELEVRRERDRAQRYLEVAEVFLVKLDQEARITLVNRYACSVLGWTASELLGRDWIETCVPERERAPIRAKFNDILAEKLTLVENHVLTRSGEERLVEWRAKLLREDDGRIIGTLSSGSDITERHEAITALRVSEERMRFALEATGVGIWDMDYRTGELQWSESLQAQYGVELGEFPGTFDGFMQRVHPEDRTALLETISEATRSGGDFTAMHRVVRPDGTVRWVSSAGRIHLDERGEPLRGVGISLDVTERHLLEEQFQQVQKMEAIGRLAGGVAHDFNNLLTAILGYCELLLSDVDPRDPRYNDISEIQKAGRSGAGLTRQLLAFSRKQIIEPTLLDMSAVVKDMRGLLGRLIGEDVNVVLALAPDLAPVMVDRGQLEQVVMNLALNARDAMPGGGTLTIETANVELTVPYVSTHFAVKPGPHAMLVVSDTGTGMPPEVQARVFEPFFTTKPIGEGTGLGLATVHGVVTRAGGSVAFQSAVGAGTSFRIYFPKADTSLEQAEPPPRDPVSRTGKHTVLVVEDAVGLRELVSRLLKRRGYNVLTAADAAQALRVFEENGHIDVLLTDVVMPGASGPELSRQLVERSPTLKVVYMSGYTDDTIVHHGVLNPGIAFLHKPFTADMLERKLREVMSG